MRSHGLVRIFWSSTPIVRGSSVLGGVASRTIVPLGAGRYAADDTPSTEAPTNTRQLGLIEVAGGPRPVVEFLLALERPTSAVGLVRDAPTGVPAKRRRAWRLQNAYTRSLTCVSGGTRGSAAVLSALISAERAAVSTVALRLIEDELRLTSHPSCPRNRAWGTCVSWRGLRDSFTTAGAVASSPC